MLQLLFIPTGGKKLGVHIVISVNSGGSILLFCRITKGAIYVVKFSVTGKRHSGRGWGPHVAKFISIVQRGVESDE